MRAIQTMGLVCLKFMRLWVLRCVLPVFSDRTEFKFNRQSDADHRS